MEIIIILLYTRHTLTFRNIFIKGSVGWDSTFTVPLITEQTKTVVIIQVCVCNVLYLTLVSLLYSWHWSVVSGIEQISIQKYNKMSTLYTCRMMCCLQVSLIQRMIRNR